MKKLERQKEHQERVMRESIAHSKATAAEAGLGFVDHELPPDEVDEKKVKRTMIYSLRSMIPYTNEWYEANAAEEEMDDLTKIRIERVKANDLYVKAKMGKHEEALTDMMAETNYDFFYFNKLKYKMEQEGKFSFEIPKNVDMFGTDINKNRLRKAINLVLNAIDENTTSELMRLGNIQGAGHKRYDNNSPCCWRGKNKAGEGLICANRRLRRPDRIKSEAEQQVQKAEHKMPDYFQFCSYHVTFCVSEAHEVGENVRIRTPNLDALCSECFMGRYKKKPAAIATDNCPGVSPVNLVSGLNAGNIKSIMEDEDDDDESLGRKKKKKAVSRGNLCTWTPNPDHIEVRGFECCNELMIDPNSGHRLQYCPWHVLRCIRPHPINSSDSITIPNQYGLCAMHHLAEHSCPPPLTAVPYPGMRVKLSKDFWKRMKLRHFGVPRDDPQPVYQLPDYEPPRAPDNIFDLVDTVVRYAKYLLKYHRESKRAALLIQSVYRMYRKRCVHFDPMAAKYRRLRHIAAIQIQTQMRRFLQTKYMQALRKLYFFSATQIQRVIRGIRCRMKLRIDWAAKRITKFMKLLHFFKFKDSVIMIMQLRRFFKKRNLLAIEIQRVYRGYIGRKYVFHKRLWTIIGRVYARKIQRVFRLYAIRRRLKPFAYPTKEWMYAQCAKKLALLIYEYYVDHDKKQRLYRKLAMAAPPVQKMMRGFLARRGTKKLSFLRKALQSWFQPHFAVDFMEGLLKNRIVDDYYFSLVNKHKVVEVVVDDTHNDKQYIRAFLPPERQRSFEVDYRTFDVAIEAWYKSIQLPLVESEKQALLKTFKNPINGHMMVRLLDEYIHHHTLPCRKHGRRVCGSCYFRKKCMMRNCHCGEYKKAAHTHKHGICIRCDHPQSLHSLVPLQMKASNSKGEKKPPLLDVLAFQGEADMSIPINITGVSIDNVLIRDIDEDDKRQIRRDHMAMERSIKAQGLLPFNTHRSDASPLLLTQGSCNSSNSSVGSTSLQSLASITQKSPKHGAAALSSTHGSTAGGSVAGNSAASGSTLGRVATKEEKHTLARSLARLEVEGDNMFDNHIYWDQYSLSSVKPGPPPSSSDHPHGETVIDTSIYEKVQFDSHPPDVHNITYDDFWNIVSKNPNKKTLDYHEKFDHNMPVPLIHEGELVYTFDGAQVYYNIVNQIIQMSEQDIHYDHPILLKLVMDHIQIFERHWRKMVVDIRLGKLDKKLTISREARLVFESTNVPRPNHASRLDDAFRKLGFHKKVLGKDIEIKAYAPKKTKEEMAAAMQNNIQAAKTEVNEVLHELRVIKSREGSPAKTKGRGKSRSPDRKAPPAKPVDLSQIPIDEATLRQHTNVRMPVDGLQANIFKVDDGDIKRKYSLPFEPSEVSILSMSRPNTNGRALSRHASATTSPEKIRGMDICLPSSSPPRTAHSQRLPSLRSAKTPEGTARPGSSTTLSPSRPTTSKRELLKDLGLTFFQNKALLEEELNKSNKGHFSATIIDQLTADGNKNRPSSATIAGGSTKRRRSHTEAQIPASQEEVNAANYDVFTLPRDKTAFREVMKLTDDRYVCPFPACGCTFLSKDAALRHMPQHEQRTRLYASTPQSDSHLQFYWPQDVPWLKANKFTEKTLPPGAVRCSHPGCPEIFGTQAKLDAHLRLVHMKVHPSAEQLGYYHLERNLIAIPPDQPPHDFYLPWCFYHSIPVGRCPLCVDIENNDGPKPPYNLYDSISIDFNSKQDALNLSVSAAEMKNLKKSTKSSTKLTTGVIRLYQRDHQYVLQVQREQTQARSRCNSPAKSSSKRPQTQSGGEFKARALFIVLDRKKIAYLGVEQLYTMNEISLAGLPYPFIPEGTEVSSTATNNKYELYPARVVTGETANSIAGTYKKLVQDNIVWIPVHAVKKVFPLMYINSKRFVHASKQTHNIVPSVDQVPLGTYFTRTEP